VEVDLDRAQALGINPGDVRRTAATVLSGIEVGNLFEEQKVFEVVVRGTPAVRSSLTDVQQLLIDTPDGGQVRLDDVADVRVTPTANVIRHEDVSQYVDLGVDVSGRDIDAVAGDIEDRIQALDFPLEYHAELLGDYSDEQSARLSFILLAVGAAIGVFLLLQAAFSSWRLASVVALALPAALAGGAVAALVDGDDVTIGTIAGFLGVFALAVRHTLLFVRRCRDLEDVDGVPFGPEVVRRASDARFGPTVTSVVATGLAVLPLLFFGGDAGHEIVHPMVVVLLGGLITSTALVLFVLPTVYLRFGSRREVDRERFDVMIDLTAPVQAGDDRHVPSTVDA
jgi:Cu/Ag efflux pump CusA